MAIRRTTQNRLIEIALQHCPEEACGFIAKDQNGKYDVVGVLDNISSHPEKAFEISRFMAFCYEKAYGKERLAFWHSHPEDDARPSKEDIGLMVQLEMEMIIVGLKPFPTIKLYGVEGRRIVLLKKESFKEAA